MRTKKNDITVGKPSSATSNTVRFTPIYTHSLLAAGHVEGMVRLSSPQFYTSSTLLPLVLSIYRSLLHTFDPSTFTLARSCSLLLPLPCCLRTACLYKNANCNKLASQQKLVWSGRSSAVQRLCAFDAENAWDFADA